MKLYFKNSYGEERVIANPKNEEEAIEAIHAFCDERNFRIYYIRSWMSGNRKKYDCGSWSEFFYLDYEEE